MNDITQDRSPLPADNLARVLTLARPNDDASLRHIALAGNIYTILLDGKQTDGHFCLIDMLVNPGGGPRPHRHDFEETFVVLEGEIEATFRGEKRVVRTGETINIPANAPHSFVNNQETVAHLLCLCSQAGQEEFFLQVGVPVASRTARPPDLTEEEKAATAKKAGELAATYRTEFLPV